MAKSKPSVTAKKASRSSKKAPKPAAPAPKSARSKSSAGEMIVTVDRRRSEQRKKSQRREEVAPVVAERRKLERRTKVSRRRQIDPTTCERDYSLEEIEFMSALDDYKRTSGRMFPTCSEILEVFRKLGYTKQSVAVEAPVVAEGSPAAPLVAEAAFAPLGLFQSEQLLV